MPSKGFRDDSFVRSVEGATREETSVGWNDAAEGKVAEGEGAGLELMATIGVLDATSVAPKPSTGEVNGAPSVRSGS